MAPANKEDSERLLDECAAAAAEGRLSRALELAARASGRRLGPLPDFELASRDPRQDLEYGSGWKLCEKPGAYAGARSFLAWARRRHPGRAELGLLSGAAETLAGRLAPGRRLLSAALELGPDGALRSWLFAWRGAATAMLARRRRAQEGLGEALSDFDRSVELGAARLFAYPWRAELRHDLDDHEGALADLEQLLKAQPALAWGRVERGEILCEKGRFEEAMAEFDRLAAERPKESWVWCLRGRTLATSGRARESLADLDRAVRLAPRSGAARAWRSEALRKLGRYRAAGAELDRAVELEPGFVLAWIWRGRLKLLRGRPAEALADLERALRLDRRYRLAFAWRGEALFKLGRPRRAWQDFRRLSPMDPMRTWNSVVREGEPLSAEARERAYWDDLERSARERPRDAWARRLLDEALARSGRAEEAA